MTFIHFNLSLILIKSRSSIVKRVRFNENLWWILLYKCFTNKLYLWNLLSRRSYGLCFLVFYIKTLYYITRFLKDFLKFLVSFFLAPFQSLNFKDWRFSFPNFIWSRCILLKWRQFTSLSGLRASFKDPKEPLLDWISDWFLAFINFLIYLFDKAIILYWSELYLLLIYLYP